MVTTNRITNLFDKPSFKDKRGTISNLVPSTPIQHIALITSVRGAIRGNHYHRLDSHYTVLLSGKAKYTELIAGRQRSWVLRPGSVILTRSKTPHVFLFLENSEFIALCTQRRDMGRYEEDTIRHIILSERPDGPKM